MTIHIWHCTFVVVFFVSFVSDAKCQETEKVYPSRFSDVFEVGRPARVNLRSQGNLWVMLYSQPTQVKSRIVSKQSDYFVISDGTTTDYVPYASVKMMIEYLHPQLGKQITQEFQRAPLQEFMKTIASKVEVDIKIDSEALKREGYTLNMPQNVVAEKTSAKELLKGLIERYPALVLAVQDDHYLLTSSEFAAANEWEVVSLK